MPSRLAPGHLHLTYELHLPEKWNKYTSLFRISQWPLGILGIAQASSTSQIATFAADFKAQLDELLPPDALIPLATNCIAFEEEGSRITMDIKDALPGVVIIPHVMGNKQLYLNTLVAELCSNILAGFSDIVITSLSGIISITYRSNRPENWSQSMAVMS